MDIILNGSQIRTYQANQNAQTRLYASMQRLSTGTRLNRPGDAPADFSIASALRQQITNTQESYRNIEKAQSMINTADSWLQEVQNMLSRMSELAIASADASKSNGDRANLQLEFSQLQEEISRIGRDARYNGIQVAGRDQILSYDQDKETFVFSQIDGSEAYSLDQTILSGVKSKNGIDFNFDPSNDYVMSQDGKSIYYVDSNNGLNKYNIETNEIARDSNDTEAKGMEVDENGRLWVATETTTGSGVYTLYQQDTNTWGADTTLISAGDIADMASTEMSFYENRVYYMNTSGNIVSRSLQNIADVKVELDGSQFAFNTTDGKFAISEDGQYLVDTTAANTIRVTNMTTNKSTSIDVDSAITVDQVKFSVDNREVVFTDSAGSALYRVPMKAGDKPTLSGYEVLRNASGGTGFAGFSVDGGSHAANFHIHSGPDHSQWTFVTAADVRLNTLGLTRLKITGINEAQEAVATIAEAIDRVSVQRSMLGAEASRLSHTYDAMRSYEQNISDAESIISDTDMASESAEMARWQVQQEAAMAMIAQSNTSSQRVLSLLNR